MQSPEFAAISPMRRVPVLADGDLHICESAAIISHLDEVLDGPPLLPADAAGRARARAVARRSRDGAGPAHGVLSRREGRERRDARVLPA